MNIKDKVFSFVFSALVVVFGVFLLLDQLDIPFIDEFFTPWYTIIFLFLACVFLALGIIKKAPIHYVLSMFFASLYLVISLTIKVEGLTFWKIMFIIPMFVGIGVIIGDLVCKWTNKALRIGLIITMFSAIILVSSILDVWTIIVPVVIILFGVVVFILTMIDLRKDVKRQEYDDDRFVTPTKNKMSAKDDDKK